MSLTAPSYARTAQTGNNHRMSPAGNASLKRKEIRQFSSLSLRYSNIKNTAAITEVLTLKFADGLTTLMNYIRSVVNHSNLCYS